MQERVEAGRRMGEDRSRRGRTGLVLERNERVLQLLVHQGVVEQQGLMEGVVFGWESANESHEGEFVIQLIEIEAGRTEGLHVGLEL